MSLEFPPYLRPVADAGEGMDPAGGEEAPGAGAAPVVEIGSEERPIDWDGVTHPSGAGGSRPLAEVIVEMGLVPAEQVREAIELARAQHSAPEQVLLADGALTSDGLARALAERYSLDHLDLSIYKVDMGAANMISTAAARRYQAVPVAFVDSRTLVLAMVDPSNVLAVDDIAIMTGCEVRPAVAAAEDVMALVGRLQRLDTAVTEAEAEEHQQTGDEVVELKESADDAPVIKLVNQIMAQAVEVGASDVHLVPSGKDLRVRFRVDGVLQDAITVPRRLAAGVVSRVKIMADLNIAERRLPQDGRVGLNLNGHQVDLRVVSLPSVLGEGLVLRILDKEAVVTELDKLGMSDHERVRFAKCFNQAYGAVLVTGPTGSGKSTTLYAALQALNTPDKNIITIEDPVEYQVAGITQVQVMPRIGLTFAAGLRAMVRADPDIIMVGEIRDRETAQIAVESALTGHLVLSTLHTNDAPTAITRLVEMGIEPFLVASSVDCVVAQRLVRTLCQHCKKPTTVTGEVLRENGFASTVDIEAFEAGGCGRCSGTGYRGRVGLYEVMTLSPDIRSMAVERRPADEIREVAVRQGMRRLREDGLEKVRLGRTSVAEVARVIGTT
jgi:type IV pilus assembly protein PilB